MDAAITGTRAAQNQSLYRSVNEQVETINTIYEDSAGASSEWICECADTDCESRVFATVREYEAVRANARTFIVSPGHVYPEVERVLFENDRYTTVEKFNDGGEIAEALDPRQTS